VNFGGRVYHTVEIGTQCWFSENLNIGTMIQGDQEQANNSITEKYCYDNSEANCDLYGGLYQWGEVVQYDESEVVQGICPSGWRVPSNQEFFDLTNFLGGDSIAGGKMKTTGTIQDGTGLWWAPNAGATNSSNFTGLPAGGRGAYPFTSFSYKSIHAEFWSSSRLCIQQGAWTRTLFHDKPLLNGGTLVPEDLTTGASVRCIKNE